MSNEQEIIERIVARHGESINLRESPQTIIDILRRFGSVLDDPGDGGPLPGGTPPEPPAPPPPPEPPPGPDQMRTGPTIEDVMKEVLNISRSVDQLSSQFEGLQQGLRR